MHREDNSKYLLYIEPDPKLKSDKPVEDEITRAIDQAMEKAVEGTGCYSNLNEHDELENFQPGYGYKGVHHAPDGEISSNKDYMLECGFITNNLAPYYVRWYRDAIPQQDMEKLKLVHLFYSV